MSQTSSEVDEFRKKHHGCLGNQSEIIERHKFLKEFRISSMNRLQPLDVEIETDRKTCKLNISKRSEDFIAAHKRLFIILY